MRRNSIVLALALLVTFPALAATSVLTATANPDVVSTFTLDFGPYGSTAANISHTNLTLELDSAVATAKFNNYYQSIDPLTLPGGMSTGDITVTILPSRSLGSIDAQGAFAIPNDYAITFTADLTAFGLESPVILSSVSTGTVTYATDQTGTIDMTWAGQGVLGTSGIPFSYTCAVSTVFEQQVPPTGDINGDGHVDLTDLALLLASYGACNGDGNYSAAADLDASGCIELADLVNILATYGRA